MEHGATFGEVLRTVGYRTLIAGKWHQTPLPTTRGFDRYYGLADGCSNFFNPGLKARPGEGPPDRKGQTRVRRWAIEDKVIMGYTSPDKKFYHTDAFTSYAIDRLDEYKGEDKPFLPNGYPSAWCVTRVLYGCGVRFKVCAETSWDDMFDVFGTLVGSRQRTKLLHCLKVEYQNGPFIFMKENDIEDVPAIFVAMGACLKKVGK